MVDHTAPDGLVSHGPAVYSGDWTGTDAWASAWEHQGSAYALASLGVFDGEVAGCGSGRFAFVDTGVSSGTSGGWVVVPGTGSGELDTFSATGTWQNLEGSPDAGATGVLTGFGNCGDEDTHSVSGSIGGSSSSPLFGTVAAGPVEVSSTSAVSGATTTFSQELPGSSDGSVAPVVLSDGFATLHLDGSWSGDATLHLARAESPPRDAWVEVAVARFEGTVEGCGTGSMMLVTVDRHLWSAVPAPRLWEVVPSLGTGDLATATGVGSGAVDPTAGTGTFVGTMSCG